MTHGHASLDHFLTTCDTAWSVRDRTAVVRKLAHIGVSEVSDLLRLEAAGVLNDALAAAGQRRFTPDTLAAIRAASATSSTSCTTCTGHQDDDGDDDDLDEFAQLLSDCINRTNLPTGTWQQRSHQRSHMMEDVLLRRQVNRGLAYIDQAAKEVHMRNEKLSQCLDEVQADISRMSDRMQAARRERERGRTATSAAASRLFTAHPANVERQVPSQPGRKYAATPPRTTPASSRAQRKSAHSAFQGGSPRCARAAEQGFRFGGWQPSPHARAGVGSNGLPEHVLQESIRAQLATIRQESKADQKAAIKRLLVQWHPDRNLDSPETATAVFQFIQQEKDKMLGEHR
mmetsp:Transcript_3707/g.8644  ORF Transcript_3707/g.8644 Transcript_3707/m.8644 type:complete len:344 (-) Transcript_3707:55-1086(-)